MLDLYGEKSRMNVRSIRISRKRTVSLIRVGIFSFSRFLISEWSSSLSPWNHIIETWDYSAPNISNGHQGHQGHATAVEEEKIGLTVAVLEYSVKKYKSHRRLSASINLATLDMENKTKKEEEMTFKRSKQIKLHILMTTSNFILFIYFFFRYGLPNWKGGIVCFRTQ